MFQIVKFYLHVRFKNAKNALPCIFIDTAHIDRPLPVCQKNALVLRFKSHI
jgi:hypothetical protein